MMKNHKRKENSMLSQDLDRCIPFHHIEVYTLQSLNLRKDHWKCYWIVDNYNADINVKSNLQKYLEKVPVTKYLLMDSI